MTRKLVVFTLLTLFLATLGAPSFSQDAQVGDGAQVENGPDVGNASEVGKDSAERSEQNLRRVWWNNMVRFADLELSTEVRRQMDQAARDYLASTEPVDQRRLRIAMAEALAAGDWAKAEADAELLAEAVAKPVRRQIELKIAIYKLLTSEQRSKLQEISPNLGGKIWIRHPSQPRSPIRRQRAQPDN